MNILDYTIEVKFICVLGKLKNIPGAFLPNKKYKIRCTNRFREGKRPPVPGKKDWDFPLSLDGFPEGFFLTEVYAETKNKKNGKIERRRHLLFATAVQLRLLANAHRFYMDGTFKIIDKPFKQLYSIHGFVKGVIKYTVIYEIKYNLCIKLGSWKHEASCSTPMHDDEALYC